MPESPPPGEIAQIVIDVGPQPTLQEWQDESASLLDIALQNREELEAEMAATFAPFEGTLVPGELEIRAGSVELVLHVLGDIAQWTATAAGVLGMLEYLHQACARRAYRVLARRSGNLLWVTSGVIPVALLSPTPQVAPGHEPTAWSERYLIVSNAVLLATVLGVLIVLLVHSL